MNPKDKVNFLIQKSKNLSPSQIIQFAYKEFGDKLVFASSLGEEDQVITDLIANTQPEIPIFTLDTGRLFQETYELIEKTQKRYKLNFEIYSPNTEAVEQMVNTKGINLFYESVENRKECCHVRKIEPLKRALRNRDAWICGLRREQSITRTDIDTFEWDAGNQKIKINPLVNWTLNDLHAYIQEHNVDVNPLHQKGFLSIGCAPCTRAVKDGEDIRAGRWWWENPETKECGLHNNPNRESYLKSKKEQA